MPQNILPRFDGRWNVADATLPNGEFAYTGSISTDIYEQTYRLIWEISAGAYVGIGIAYSDHLYVSCGETYDRLGIALYYCDEEGLPSGLWSTPELDGMLGSVQFLSPWTGTFEGSHTVIHHSPNNSERTTFTLQITKNNAIYEVVWSDDQQQRIGLGIAMADGIAVGWYPDLQQLAFLDYYVEPHNPDQLSAQWALGGFTTLGTETLTRTQ